LGALRAPKKTEQEKFLCAGPRCLKMKDALSRVFFWPGGAQTEARKFLRVYHSPVLSGFTLFLFL
jgi:hypothetical protein